MKNKISSSVTGTFAALLLALISTSASAQLINVQFGAIAPTNPPSAVIAPPYVGQGVIAGGNFWNQITSPANNFPLLSDTSVATGVTLSTTSIVTYNQQRTANATAPDALIQNIAFTFGQQPITLTISGLVANMAYDVVVYDGLNPTDFSLNGSALQEVSGTPTHSNATFVSGVSYTEFTGSADAQGSLVLVATVPTSFAPGSGEVDISGLQVSSVPEPTTYGMVFIGLGLFFFARRFSKIRAA